MNRSRTFRWARRAVWGTLAVVLTIGCNPLATIAFLTHRDTPVPAKYPFINKDEPKKENEEVVVALFVSQGTGQSFEFAGAEATIASEMARKIPELAKENKQKITVIPPALVNKFKMNNPTWKDMHASAWGKRLGADFVLEIHLDKMRLYQPGSVNQLYEGRAEVSVFMYDVKEGAAEPKYYTHPYSFPKTGFWDATSIPLGKFKKEFLERLAVEIAQYHIDYKADSGIAEKR
jgi:hypothetical protein